MFFENLILFPYWIDLILFVLPRCWILFSYLPGRVYDRCFTDFSKDSSFNSNSAYNSLFTISRVSCIFSNLSSKYQSHKISLIIWDLHGTYQMLQLVYCEKCIQFHYLIYYSYIISDQCFQNFKNSFIIHFKCIINF